MKQLFGYCYLAHYRQLTTVCDNSRRTTAASGPLPSSHPCSVRWQCSASSPIMFVAISGWLLARARLTQMGLELSLVVCQALPLH